MEQIIIKIFADQFGQDPSTITLDMCIANNFAADSLDLVGIVMAIQQSFGIELEDECQETDSIANIIALVQRKLKS